MMICSAPSRFAAITPQRPTAPSPTTAAVLPGRRPWPRAPRGGRCPSRPRASAATASARRPRRPAGRRAFRRPAGRAPPRPGRRRARSRPRSRRAGRRSAVPRWQKSQVPSDQANGATTRSPGFTVRTSAPTASTTPMNSWPIRRPVSLGSIWLYGQRSLPQMQARVTRTKRVGRLDDPGVGDVLDADVAGAVHDSCFHRVLLLSGRSSAAAPPRSGRPAP